MNIKNYHDVCEALYPHLADYLHEHGIDTSKNFTCLNPAHEDKHPSMGLAPSGKAVHCFSCGWDGSIFHVANVLEGNPLVGQEFIQDSLIPLAKKYGIEIESAPLTEEQVYELDTYRAYREAAAQIKSGRRTEAYSKAVEARGWTTEICEEFGVGCVADYNQFREVLKTMGFRASFLDDIDLSRKEIFGEDRLIFPIRDEHGRPVGFSSRNLAYTEDKQHGAKYVNQRSTGVKCNIYKKSTRLYGFDRVLVKHQKKPKPIYIFEGYSDVITAVQHGIDSCVGLGGTSLTVEQVLLLKQHKYYDIILCLDADEAGQSRTQDLLDKILSGHKDLKVRIVTIPENKDPDEFIRTHGVDKFKKLKKWTAFEWRLQRFTEETEPEAICEAMIPLIVNEASYVAQEKMCKTLAKETGVSLKTIQYELQRLQNKKEDEKAKERQVILDKLVQSCKLDPSHAEELLQQAQEELYSIARQYEEDNLSEESTLSIIEQQKSFEEAKDGSFSGFRLGPDLQNLEHALCGEWKKDVWMCIGGQPNAGKSSLLVKIITEIASRYEENNATVIYHTIDDTAQQTLPKFVCVADGSRRLVINQVIDPNYHVRNTSDELARKTLVSRREEGYNKLVDLVRTGHLVIKDANDGASLAYIETLIKYYREKYPDRNLVYVLDNFHKLTDFGAGKADERVRMKEISKIVKGLCTKYHICLITTVEYRKTLNGQRAGNQDVAETIQIVYDANLIAHLHNTLHDKGEKCPAHMVHMSRVGDSDDIVRMPIIELNIGKNKITGFKERLYFEFYPACSDFAAIDEKIILSKMESEDEEQADFAEGSPFAGPRASARDFN